MRTSETGRWSNRVRSDTGFSLLELMLVTTMLAIVSLAAVLCLRLAPNETPAAQMEDVARAVRFLRDEATSTRRNLGMAFADGHWWVLELDESSEHWKPRTPDRPYNAGTWSEEFEATLEIEDRQVIFRRPEDETTKPDVLILSSGESTPFRITFVDGAGNAASCRLDAFGELECRRGT